MWWACCSLASALTVDAGRRGWHAMDGEEPHRERSVIRVCPDRPRGQVGRRQVETSGRQKYAELCNAGGACCGLAIWPSCGKPISATRRRRGARLILGRGTMSLLTGRSALDVPERRDPQSGVGNGRGNEQPAGPLAEIAPPSSGGPRHPHPCSSLRSSASCAAICNSASSSCRRTSAGRSSSGVMACPLSHPGHPC